MIYEDFKAAVPSSRVTEDEFPALRAQAETALQDLIVYDAGNLSGGALAAYNAALAFQVDYAAVNGACEGKVSAQSVNGVSATFALTAGGADALNVSPLAGARLRSAKLCVRF